MTLASFEDFEGLPTRNVGVRRRAAVAVAPGALSVALALVAGWGLVHRQALEAAAPQILAGKEAPTAPANPYGPLAAAADPDLESRLLASAMKDALAEAEAGRLRGALGSLVAFALPPARSSREDDAFVGAPPPLAMPAPPATPVVAAAVPLPPSRPAEFSVAPPPPPPPARPLTPSEVASAPVGPSTAVVPDQSLVGKLFGWSRPVLGPPAPPAASPTPQASPTPVALAIAKPIQSVPAPAAVSASGSFGSVTGGDPYAAVYDLTARVLYMPDGTKLEAHSGYGDKIDDPRFVNTRMVGATPPNTYTLSMRESLFHGVEAVRLTPVGDSPLYGRAGLLVHPYMLGPNGDSNGCVSIKDYDAFLKAYKDGLVKKLVVVAKLD